MRKRWRWWRGSLVSRMLYVHVRYPAPRLVAGGVRHEWRHVILEIDRGIL